MNRKKKENAAQSTRQLMGIDSIKNYCIATRMGDLVFFIIKPTNISVLSDSSISARIYALLKSYVGGLLCEKSLCYSAKNARAKYWFSQNPRQVTCCVTMRCTGFFPPSFPQGGMKL